MSRGGTDHDEREGEGALGHTAHWVRGGTHTTHEHELPLGRQPPSECLQVSRGLLVITPPHTRTLPLPMPRALPADWADWCLAAAWQEITGRAPGRGHRAAVLAVAVLLWSRSRIDSRALAGAPRNAVFFLDIAS